MLILLLIQEWISIDIIKSLIFNVMFTFQVSYSRVYTSDYMWNVLAL